MTATETKEGQTTKTDRPPHSLQMVFRATDSELGRTITVTPANSANRHLSYGRIRLNADYPAVSFHTGEQETGLIVLSGDPQVEMGGQSQLLGRFDAIYIPKGSAVKVSASSPADIAEFSAPVSGDYPLQLVRYADVEKDRALKFTAGSPTQQRVVTIQIGKNVEAGRILGGFTVSDPGNWTSWPPHEHAAMLEEMYVYFDMPEPAFGLQMVYTDTKYPEMITPVRQGDAVLMPRGYHPNVAAPGHRICFLWLMAAHREKEDRVYGVVNVQPGFGAGGSGLEASRK